MNTLYNVVCRVKKTEDRIVRYATLAHNSVVLPDLLINQNSRPSLHPFSTNANRSVTGSN